MGAITDLAKKKNSVTIKAPTKVSSLPPGVKKLPGPLGALQSVANYLSGAVGPVVDQPTRLVGQLNNVAAGLEKRPNLVRTRIGQTAIPKPKVGQVVGDLAGTAMTVEGVLSAFGLLGKQAAIKAAPKLFSKEFLKDIGKKTLTRGAPIGAGFGIAQGLGENRSPKEIAKLAATYAAISPFFEAGSSLLGKLSPRTKREPLPEVPKERTVPDAVVQVVNGKEKTFYRIPESQKDNILRVIDNERVKGTGEAGKLQESGDILHVTAKPPEAMLKRGFKDGGVITSEELASRIKQEPKFVPDTVPMGKVRDLNENIPGTETRSRAKQVQEFAQKTIRSVEADKKVQQTIADLGGGKVVSNKETILKASRELEQDSQSFLDEMKTWPADKPVNEVITTKANLVIQYLNTKIQEASKSGDIGMLQDAVEALKEVYPGYQNITATGPRATQVQSAFGELGASIERINGLVKNGAGATELISAVRDINTRMAQWESLKGVFKPFGIAMRSLENYATAAKLTSIMTHVTNFVSNVFNILHRGLERTSIAGQRLTKGDLSGAKASMHFGFIEGITTGARDFMSTLLDDAAATMKGEANRTTIQGIIADKMPQGLRKGLRVSNVFRWLDASDQFFRGIIKTQELTERAYRQAYAEKTTDLPGRIKEILSNPPKEWIEHADKVASEYTYREAPDKFIRRVMAIRNLPGGRFIQPFILTPYNIVKYQFQRSPAGVLSPRNIKDIVIGDVRQREEAVARLITGSLLSTAAYFVVANGTVTGARPKDRGQGALWDAQGKQPWSIKIGNKWVGYNRIQPLGLYLTQVAAVKDLIDSGDWKQADAAGLRLAGAMSNAIQDMSFMSGLNTVFEFINDPERNIKSVQRLIEQGFIPSALRDVRQQQDINRRESVGGSDFIKDVIPGQSQKLQSKIDIFGNPIQLEKNKALRLTKIVLTAKDSKASKILEDAKYAPALPDTKLEISRRGNKRSVQLPPREAEQYLREQGKATEQAILYVSTFPGYKNLTQAQKEYLLKTRISAVRGRITEKWNARYFSNQQVPTGSGLVPTVPSGGGAIRALRQN